LTSLYLYCISISNALKISIFISYKKKKSQPIFVSLLSITQFYFPFRSILKKSCITITIEYTTSSSLVLQERYIYNHAITVGKFSLSPSICSKTFQIFKAFSISVDHTMILSCNHLV
jgi:hypothetical protein